MRTLLLLIPLLLFASCLSSDDNLLVGFDDLLVPAAATEIRLYQAEERDGQVVQLSDSCKNRLYRTFDAQGFTVTLRMADSLNNASTQHITYDVHNRILDYRHDYPHFSMHLEQEDTNNLRIRYRFEYREGDQVKRTNTFYHEEQNGISTLASQAGIPIQRIYRNPERQIAKTDHFDRSGHLSYTDTYTYQGKLLVSEAHIQGHQSHISTYQYTQFDRKGNWTERIKRLNDQVVAIERRTIHYSPQNQR